MAEWNEPADEGRDEVRLTTEGEEGENFIKRRIGGEPVVSGAGMLGGRRWAGES